MDFRVSSAQGTRFPAEILPIGRIPHELSLAPVWAGSVSAVWLATLLTLCVGQTEARVVREDGTVCIETLGARGEVTRDCRPEATPWTSPRVSPPPPRPPPRAVAGVSLGLGVLTSERVTSPEVAFVADVGVLFPNGTGIVGLLHAQVSPLVSSAEFGLLQHYGLGAALRLGRRSHLLLGVSGAARLVQDQALHASPSLSILLKGALVLSDSFTLVLLPIFSLAEAVTFSFTVGIGVTL